MVGRRTLAVIPARGGSKRIPRKNIVEFHGKPLIAWTIEACIASGRFDRVLVSTDDPEIAEVATRFGVEVPFLRERLADDVSAVSLVTLHALDQLERNLGEAYEIVAQLMPNCPLRAAADIDAALDHFSRREAPFQISCFKFGWMNPWWAATLDERGRPTPLFRECLNQRSQDLEELYCPTGAIWVARVDALQTAQTFYGPEHVFLPMPWQAAVDIDDYADLEMAKAVYSTMKAE